MVNALGTSQTSEGYYYNVMCIRLLWEMNSHAKANSFHYPLSSHTLKNYMQPLQDKATALWVAVGG